ncbi:Uncharacterised protein [Kluyvera ascorbata]|nr:hypothetical protein WP4W18E05_P11160 [Klebsiella sp. WP4-W18-ESBL-05]BCA42545.1 hypothetical protein KATP_50670 [Kluyvera ascorbata]STX01549.1 Uncharacterised protein [Kluyvera ascorbata]
MPGTVDMISVNFAAKSFAIIQIALQDGGKIITPNIAFKSKGFRSFTNPEALLNK